MHALAQVLNIEIAHTSHVTNAPLNLLSIESYTFNFVRADRDLMLTRSKSLYSHTHVIYHISFGFSSLSFLLSIFPVSVLLLFPPPPDVEAPVSMFERWDVVGRGSAVSVSDVAGSPLGWTAAGRAPIKGYNIYGYKLLYNSKSIFYVDPNNVLNVWHFHT